MVVGVSEGYKKELELVGVGYRASIKAIYWIELGLYAQYLYTVASEIKVEKSLKEIRILLSFGILRQTIAWSSLL